MDESEGSLGLDLLQSLRLAVEHHLPAITSNAEPVWKMFILPGNPHAPVIAISRDSRAGPKVIPVFFVAMENWHLLIQFASSLYQQSGTIVRLWHGVNDTTPPYIVIPAIFTEVADMENFRITVKSILHELELTSHAAWFCEECEVMIKHNGRFYTAHHDHNGFKVVVSS